MGQLDVNDQVVMGTNGAISADAGSVTMNASGIQVGRAAGSSPVDTNAYTFVDGATAVGGLYSYTPSSVYTLSLINSRANSFNHIGIQSNTRTRVLNFSLNKVGRSTNLCAPFQGTVPY